MSEELKQITDRLARAEKENKENHTVLGWRVTYAQDIKFLTRQPAGQVTAERLDGKGKVTGWYCEVSGKHWIIPEGTTGGIGMWIYDFIEVSPASIKRASCEWKFDENHCKWDTACGEAFFFDNDGPEENGTKFCMYCGQPIHLPTGKGE